MFNCPTCNDKFTLLQALVVHSAKKHPENVDLIKEIKLKAWYCNYCERQFRSSKNFYEHQKSLTHKKALLASRPTIVTTRPGPATKAEIIIVDDNDSDDGTIVDDNYDGSRSASSDEDLWKLAIPPPPAIVAEDEDSDETRILGFFEIPPPQEIAEEEPKELSCSSPSGKFAEILPYLSDTDAFKPEAKRMKRYMKTTYNYKKRMFERLLAKTSLDEILLKNYLEYAIGDSLDDDFWKYQKDDADVGDDDMILEQI